MSYPLVMATKGAILLAEQVADNRESAKLSRLAGDPCSSFPPVLSASCGPVFVIHCSEVRKSLPPRSPFDDLARTRTIDIRTPPTPAGSTSSPPPTTAGSTTTSLLRTCPLVLRIVALLSPPLFDCVKQPRPCTIPSSSLFLVASSPPGTSRWLGAAAPYPFLW